ncbi:MAG: ABC transporter ATP-binding protein/permease [bacterium]|nr:ABC transporter ATP-binding protein/permease [bacterium]
MKKIVSVFTLLKPHKRSLIIGLVFALLANVFDILGPYVLKLSFDVFQKNFRWNDLLPYAVLLLLFALIRGFFRFKMRMKVVGVSRDLEFDLRTTYFDHLLKLPSQFFDLNKTGDLMNRATSDIENVRMMLGPALMYATNTIVIMIVSFSVMFALSVELTLYMSIILPAVVVSVGWMGREEFLRTDAQQESLSELSAAVQENLSGIRVIRSYSLEQREIENLEKHNQKFFDKSVRLLRIDMLFTPLLGIIFSFGFSIILWKGGLLVLANKITLGTLVAFISYLGLLGWPMIAIGWVANLMQRGLASWNRIQNILSEPLEKEINSILTIQNGSIEFKNVSFSYNNDTRMVLKDIDFELPAGKSLGILGKTGSGKTTLVSLIPRLYTPTEGKIFIDGEEIQNYSIATLRSSIGFVPQEAFLFSATIAENIAFGKSDAKQSEIETAAKQSLLYNDIEQFENGLKTLVGERGLTLSGGQKQRTAIARAFLINPKILILDDPLANVDTETEHRILQYLYEFMKKRTTIIISHRASTVMNCDYLIVLDHGEIVEQGEPSQLIREDSYFRKLVERQRIAEELEEVA